MISQLFSWATLFNHLFQSIMNRTNEHLSSALGAEDDVIEHVMDRMLFVNVGGVHDSYCSGTNVACQHSPPNQPKRNGFSSPA
jgi:hypothetical protein